jgi:plasmid stabilization system protein ParE
MLRVKRHPLVVADFQSAYDWHQARQDGLGADFIEDFRSAYHRLRLSPFLCSVRFAKVRRLKPERFPYGIFFVVRTDEIRVLALLHASRDTESVIVARRRTFK